MSLGETAATLRRKKLRVPAGRGTGTSSHSPVTVRCSTTVVRMLRLQNPTAHRVERCGTRVTSFSTQPRAGAPCTIVQTAAADDAGTTKPPASQLAATITKVRTWRLYTRLETRPPRRTD